MWGNNDNNGNWGRPISGKKIKQQGIFNNIFKDGNWGDASKQNKNLGLSGFRGTPEENAEIGRNSGHIRKT